MSLRYLSFARAGPSFYLLCRSSSYLLFISSRRVSACLLDCSLIILIRISLCDYSFGSELSEGLLACGLRFITSPFLLLLCFLLLNLFSCSYSSESELDCLFWNESSSEPLRRFLIFFNFLSFLLSLYSLFDCFSCSCISSRLNNCESSSWSKPSSSSPIILLLEVYGFYSLFDSGRASFLP